MEIISRLPDEVFAFHRVALLGSFTQASIELSCSKSQLSKQIQRLEATLGLSLFSRTTRSLKLTESGQTLFSYSQKIFKLSEEAGRKLRDLKAGDAGLIRITAPISVGDAFLPDFFEAMRERLPKITFDADLSNDVKDFEKDEIDFALRAMNVEAPELISRPLGMLKDSIVCTPALAKKLKLTHPSQLAEQECILTSTEERWNIWNLTLGKKEVQIQVSGKIATNQYLTAKQLALKGHGITRLPTHALTHELKAKELITLFPEYQISTHPLSLVYARKSTQLSSNQMVKEWLMQWFKTQKDFFI